MVIAVFVIIPLFPHDSHYRRRSPGTPSREVPAPRMGWLMVPIQGYDPAPPPPSVQLNLHRIRARASASVGALFCYTCLSTA